MKVAILTLGCRVNQSESATIEGSLIQSGVNIVNLDEKPDYCVVNTCSVTARSDFNSRQLIRRAANAGAKVIVTGCYSQLRTEETWRLPGVWKIIDSKNKLEVIGELTGDKSAPYYAYYSRSRPHLKVQDGCNFACSYCSVPLARGKSVSVREEEIIERACIIASAGYQELVLTGIHLGSYGKDLGGDFSLKKLLVRLLMRSSIRRIRLSSLEIGEIDDEMIDILGEERICRHLHLPLQSGSERILRAMRRGYSLKAFASTIERITSKIDNLSLGTDVIVGFPGERDEDFADTLSYVSQLPLSYMHIFPFSPRAGTEAEQMKERPDSFISKRRAKILAEVNQAKKKDYMMRQLDRTLDVIVEEIDGKHFTGTSGNYLKVCASMPAPAKKSIVLVRPTVVKGGLLRGVPIQTL